MEQFLYVFGIFVFIYPICMSIIWCIGSLYFYFRRELPDLKIDGEFQLDSAIVPEVAKKKVKRESEVAGQANILIFPDLNAGNIGVKLIQQFGHSNAYGPLLQGFRKICSDCSRGAPVEELVGNIVFSVVRAGEKK